MDNQQPQNDGLTSLLNPSADRVCDHTPGMDKQSSVDTVATIQWLDLVNSLDSCPSALLLTELSQPCSKAEQRIHTYMLGYVCMSSLYRDMVQMCSFCLD